MSEEFAASFEALEKRFTCKNVDYVLREPSGEAAKAHSERLFKIAKPGLDGKPTSIDGINGVEYPFIADCLFKTAGGVESPVPLAEVVKLPSRLLQSCYKWLDSTNPKSVKDTDLKNSSEPISAGSS